MFQKLYVFTLSLAVVLVGLGATAQAQPEVPPVAGYDKGFFIRDAAGPFEFKIQGRVQVRFTYEGIEDATDEQNFSIPRARLTLSGKAFVPGLKYKFQSDFGKGFVSLKDFYVDYELAKGVVVRAGQFKRPFSRQQINSSSGLELVDRAITDAAFGAGREIGAMVHNNFDKSPEIEWAAGVFNGTTEKSKFSGVVDPMTGGVTGGKFTNVPKQVHPMVIARGGYNYGGIQGYEEADLEGGPMRLAVGAGVIVDFDADDTDDGELQGELDFVLKNQGFSLDGAFYAVSAQDGTSFGDQTYNRIGAHVQAGYVLDGKLQPAVRYALVDPDGPDNNVQEILGGLSVYFHEHNLKWQTDGGVEIAQIAGGTEKKFLARTQLQLSF